MLAILLALLPPLTCHPIHSDWINGRDLVAVVPALASLPPDLPIGLAPLPGQQRVFRAADLKRLALANRLSVEMPDNVCFAWTLAIPDREAIKFVMLKALANRQPTVEILETSLLPVPEGEMEFPLSGLSLGASGPAMWRGFVHYAGTRKVPVWARVHVEVKEQRVTAAAALHAGDFLSLDQIKLENYQGPPQRDKFILDPAQVDGFLLRCPVQAGAPLLENMLEPPREVNRGDVVNAIVQNGAARLDVQAVAEDSGRKGQIISVRNPRSGRSFHARVAEKGTVVVVPGGQYGLVVENKKS